MKRFRLNYTGEYVQGQPEPSLYTLEQALVSWNYTLADMRPQLEAMTVGATWVDADGDTWERIE